MRTILGFNTCLDSSTAHYLESDDISENAFLLSNGKPLRFGHKNLQFIEYGTSVTKAIKVATFTIEAYTGSKINLHIPPPHSLTTNVMSGFSEIGEFGTRYCSVKRE